MVAAELAQDGTVIWSTLVEPSHGFVRALERRRTLTVIVFSTLLSLLAARLILPTVDSEAVAAEKLRPDMTAHEREQAIETAARLYQVITWGSAALAPLASSFFLAVALWLAFWVAGARAGFKASFTVAAFGLVPAALKALLAAPAAIARAPVAPDQLARLLPSSLAALLPASLPAPALAAASALDVFTLWTLYLAGAGMLKASGASRLRTTLVLAVLFAAYVAFFKIAPSAAAPGGYPMPPPS